MPRRFVFQAALFCALLAFGLQACKIGQIPRDVRVYGFDFRPYTAKGFLFTPEAYQGNYEAVGWLRYELWSGIVAEKGTHGKTTLRYSIATASEALDTVYQDVTRMGGDAFVRLDIEQISRDNGTVPGMAVSGFAIRRIQ